MHILSSCKKSEENKKNRHSVGNVCISLNAYAFAFFASLDFNLAALFLWM